MIYDYKCTKCDRGCELMHSIKELDKPHYCPHCDGLLKKVVSKGTKPIFKGTGFYETDYKYKI